jgi:hypothetical protein
MIDATNRLERRTSSNNARSRRTRGSSARRRRRAASVSDAVIAAYIHDLHHAGRAATGPDAAPPTAR